MTLQQADTLRYRIEQYRLALDDFSAIQCSLRVIENELNTINHTMNKIGPVTKYLVCDIPVLGDHLKKALSSQRETLLKERAILIGRLDDLEESCIQRFDI